MIPKQSLEAHTRCLNNEPDRQHSKFALISIDHRIDLRRIVGIARKDNLDYFTSFLSNDAPRRVEPLTSRVNHSEAVRKSRCEFVGDKAAPIGLRYASSISLAAAEQQLQDDTWLLRMTARHSFGSCAC